MLQKLMTRDSSVSIVYTGVEFAVVLQLAISFQDYQEGTENDCFHWNLILFHSYLCKTVEELAERDRKWEVHEHSLKQLEKSLTEVEFVENSGEGKSSTDNTRDSERGEPKDGNKKEDCFETEQRIGGCSFCGRLDSGAGEDEEVRNMVESPEFRFRFYCCR